MIKVHIHRNPQGDLVEFSVKGHAGFAEYGQDIVCAGVTALVDTSLLGLQRVAAQPCEMENGEGKTWCRLTPGDQAAWQRAQVILETMLIGLNEIAATYSKHIRVYEGGKSSP